MGNVFFAGGKIEMNVPVGGIPLTSFPVGTKVKLNVDGTARNFIIINQGIPQQSTVYDSSCDGTWLLMEDLYSKWSWGSAINYDDSLVHSYLNDTFFSLLDAEVQSAIKEVKIPYYNNTGSNGLSTKVFLLSAYELGWSTSNDTYIPIDGACLEYFKGCEETDAKRIAYLNGAANSWWTRSMYYYLQNCIWAVKADGWYANDYGDGYYGVRPCFILPSTMFVGAEPNSDGSVNLKV